METRSLGMVSAGASRATDGTAQGMTPVRPAAATGPRGSLTAVPATPNANSMSPKQLDDAVKDINETIKRLSQNLEFTIDPDSNRTVVKVIDQQTREVLRQLPSQETLEIAKALDRLQGLLISQKV